MSVKMSTNKPPPVPTDLKALEQHFESLITEVKYTHRQFEEMLQKHASCSSRSGDKENVGKQSPAGKGCVRPVPLLNLQQIENSSKRSSSRPPRSMIEAGMTYFKPTTTPKPFKLNTTHRAVIRKAIGGSPGRVTPCPGEVTRPRSAGCSPAAHQTVKGIKQHGFQFGRPPAP